MASFKCPNCKEETLSLKDKYRIGWWMTATCPKCQSRIAAFPWTLMLLSFLYVWNVVWWIGLMQFKGGAHYLIFMVICWLFLDFINLYFMPLSRLKGKS